MTVIIVLGRPKHRMIDLDKYLIASVWFGFRVEKYLAPFEREPMDLDGTEIIYG